MLDLVSYDLCPYVQRAAIALSEKRVPFRRIDIDLAAKPAWFSAISPLGKVPLLRIGKAVIFESSVIVEYLDETQPHRLHPTDALERAHHRAWMEFGSSILADIWVLETTADAAAFETKRRSIADKFARVEAVLRDGPYFAGRSFSLVDAVFAPAYRYFDTFERFRDLGIFGALPRVCAWRTALAERPSVRAAVAADYPMRLEAFVRRHDGVFAQAMRAAA